MEAKASSFTKERRNFIEGASIDIKNYLDNVTHEKHQNQTDVWFLLKLSNSGQMNLHEWLESISEDYFEDKSLDDQMYVERIKTRFLNFLAMGSFQ